MSQFWHQFVHHYLLCSIVHLVGDAKDCLHKNLQIRILKFYSVLTHFNGTKLLLTLKCHCFKFSGVSEPKYQNNKIPL